MKKRRATLQYLIVTAAAVTLAWALGHGLSEVDALVAAIIAAITLRRSVQGSAGEAFIQILGTALGIGIAFVSLTGLGDTLAAVPVTVIAAVVTARALNLGEEGALSILITALIVVGPGLAGNTAADRAWGTVIGVGVALVFSFWAHPLTPAGRANESISKLAKNSSTLLDDIAVGISGPYTREQASRWLAQARLLDVEAERIRTQAAEATRYARWSPLVSTGEAELTHLRFLTIEHTVVQVRVIARSFYDAALAGIKLPQSIQSHVVEALRQASNSVQSVGRQDSRTECVEQAQQLREHTKKAAEAVTEHSDPEAVILGASILSNVSRIAETLQERPAALVDVASPAVDPNPLEAAAGALGRKAKRARHTLKSKTRPVKSTQSGRSQIAARRKVKRLNSLSPRHSVKVKTNAK